MLLASFVQTSEVEEAISKISSYLMLKRDDIFIFRNIDNEDETILTYNLDVEFSNIKFSSIWKNTISIHRKKYSNTLYSINAMNEYIKLKNGGRLNKSYAINWEELKNSMIIIKGGRLRTISLELVK